MGNTTENFKHLLSDIGFEALLLSKEGICVAQNEAARNLFGYSDEEAIGKTEVFWIHPIDRDLVRDKMKQNHPDTYEIVALKKDGSYFPCEMQEKVINVDNEELRLSAFRDITNRKTIEKELYDKVIEFDIIAASIPNAIWKAIFDKEGNVSEVFISDSINGLLDLPPGTINNDWNLYFSHVLPDEIENMQSKILEAINNPGEIVTHIYKVKKGNGEIAWISSSGRAQPTEKGMVGYGFSYDVSELKEHERALIELNTTKDKLFSIISHDLKNPFTAFMGFSELMIKQIDAGKYDNLRKYAGAILVEARQGSELLSNLLEWSRTQRNLVTFNPEIIEVEKFISNILNYFNQTFRSKEVELVFLNKGGGTFVGDRMMIETVIRNLLSNAVKFSKRKSKVIFTITADKSKTCFSIADQGVGIKPEDQEKLFDVNNNHTTQGTENEKGTGIGLALCGEFVDFHNGEIGVNSKPFEGAEFWFTIPKS